MSVQTDEEQIPGGRGKEGVFVADMEGKRAEG